MVKSSLVWDTRWPNFTVKELSCPCCSGIGMDVVFMDELQALRNKYKAPLFVTSGYRCPSHNVKVGGSPNSAHMQGLAVDINIYGPNLRYLLQYISSYFTGLKLIQVGDMDKRYIHLDAKLGPLRCWTF